MDTPTDELTGGRGIVGGDGLRSDGYNLIDEPWISVLDLGGQEREVSILELFERAPQLSVISGEVPTQAFAITRLLLAFLHRALDGPKNKTEWAKLWSAHAVPLKIIKAYADRMRHRFDLFDEHAPFFQVPDLHTAKRETSGLEKIVVDVPNGVPLFTTRSAASLRRIGPGEAARWLVHVHAFDPSGIKSAAEGDPTTKGGRGYPIGTGWSGQLGGVLAQGATVWETLLLNLVAYDAGAYARLGGPRDVPAWERDPDGPKWADDRPPRGAIELYTWQTRRVRLHGNRDGVTGVVLANGDKLTAQNRQLVEPHTAWRYSTPQSRKANEDVYMPRKHDPERSVWRGIGALLPSVSPRASKATKAPPYMAPGVLEWVCGLTQSGIVPDDFVIRLRVYGIEYGTQNATVAEIVDDVLPMALVVLRADQPQAGEAAKDAVVEAEAAAACLARLADNLTRAAGGDAGDGDPPSEALYAELEQPYREWLGNLRPDTDLMTASVDWQHTVRARCRMLAEELLAAAPPAAWTGREINKQQVNVSLAELWFRHGLAKALPMTRTTPNTTSKNEVAQ